MDSKLSVDTDLSDVPVNVLYWLWLSRRCRPGSTDADLLLEYFGYDPVKIYKAEEREYRKIAHIKDDLILRLCDKTAGKEREIKLYCAANNIGILTPDSPLYPKRLLRITKRPLVLYYRGRLPELNDGVLIATVGTRRMSEYGRKSAYSLSYDLARCGAIIVSGMAKGIDGICHRAALDAGGHTIAVLGCGIDRAYPPEHHALMEEIIAKGTVLTEYPPFTEPAAFHFPARNRIISGLCQGTLVLEADHKSGAMITAKLAHEQGRDLFALPGKVDDEGSAGTNALIQNGAKAVTCAEDLLCEYEYLYPGYIFPGNLRGSDPCYTPELPATAEPSRETPSGERSSKGRDRQRKKPSRRSSETAEVPLPPLKETALHGEELPGEEDYSLPDRPMRGEPSDEKKPSRSSGEVRRFPDETQQRIYEKLQHGPKTADELAEESLPMRRILPALTILEVKGVIEALPGGRFRCKED